MNENVGGNNGRFGGTPGTSGFSETLAYWNSPNGFTFRKEAHFSYAPPAGIWLSIEEHPDTLGPPSFRFVYDNARARTSGAWAQLPASRHGKSAPIMFADGHLIIKIWKDARTRKPVEGKSILGIVTPGNVDHDWMQEHTTIRKAVPQSW